MTRTRRRSSTIPEILHGAPQGRGPLRIGAHFVPKGPEHETMTWDHVERTVTAGDLDNMVRHGDCEAEYIEWAKGIRAHYGRIERYLIEERLGWTPDTLPVVESSESDPLYLNDQILGGNIRDTIKVVYNDWPYGIPLDCKHYVVWCKVPIMAPALFSTPDTPFARGELRDILYEAVTADGIRGITGNASKRVPVVGFMAPSVVRKAFDRNLADAKAGPIQSLLGPTGLGQVEDLAEAAHLWAARYMQKFVEQHWDPDLYDTVFFCNPPHLRTVPGISHAHVIAREKSFDQVNKAVAAKFG